MSASPPPRPSTCPASTGEPLARGVRRRAVLVLVQSCNHCPYVLAWEGRIDDLERGTPTGGSASSRSTRTTRGVPRDSFDEHGRACPRGRLLVDYLHDESQDVVRTLGSEHTPEASCSTRPPLVYHGAVNDNREEGTSRHYLRDAIEAALAGEIRR